MLNFLAAALACGTDTSYCARPPVRAWRGRVYASDGAPVRSATVVYEFGSNLLHSVQQEVAFPTDSYGRYCLNWPTESVTASVSVRGAIPGGPPNPALAQIARAQIAQANLGQTQTKLYPGQASPDQIGPPGGPSILVSPDARGRTIADSGWSWNRPQDDFVVAEPWDPAVDAADSCVSASPLWYRQAGVMTNWRPLLIFGVAGLAIILGYATLSSQRDPAVYARAGATAGSLAVALFVLFWVVKAV